MVKPTLVAALLAIFPLLGFSQVSDAQLQTTLQQIRNSLENLDVLAAVCLQVEGIAQGDSDDSDPCLEFRQALDGDLLADYIENCNNAKAWRDAFVTRQVQDGNAVDTGEQQQNLDRLVNIEYLCGENSLTYRTEYVATAYRQSSKVTGSALGNSLQFQIDSSRQQNLFERERSRLSESLSTQRQRTQQQTDRQFEQLELELIRQQNRQQYPR